MKKKNSKISEGITIGESRELHFTELEKILSDYTFGSQEILEFLIGLLQKLNQKEIILGIIDKVILPNFKNFEIIQQTLTQIKEYAQSHEVPEIQKYMQDIINKFYKKMGLLLRQFEKVVFPGIKILTISNSKTIFEIITRIKFYSPEVYVLESLPVGEGKIFDNRLKDFGVNSTLVKDSEMKDYVKKVDLVLMGADRIVSGKYFVNKVGSKKLAQAANKFNKPVYVVAFKEKITDSEQRRKTIKSVRDEVEKTLFERVDINLVTKFLTA